MIYDLRPDAILPPSQRPLMYGPGAVVGADGVTAVNRVVPRRLGIRVENRKSSLQISNAVTTTPTQNLPKR